jgi:hypothetical protein
LPRSMRLVEADPVQAILQACRESETDLVVMGTHGRKGLTRIRLGSVTESVLRQIRKPILTVGPQVRPSSALGRIRRVLCPVDYRELALRCIRTRGCTRPEIGSRAYCRSRSRR